MVRILYRWHWGTAWRNVVGMAQDIRWGIRNVIRWAPVIWFDADFDWDFLNPILEYKFTRMANSFEKYSSHTGHKRQIRQLRTCALLFKRIGADDYYELADKRHPERNKHWAKMARDLEKQDEQMLWRIVLKHRRSWWY